LFVYLFILGILEQVVESPTPLSNHLDGTQSAYWYFDNVQNFLVAVEDMRLPTFEASDLEQVMMNLKHKFGWLIHHLSLPKLVQLDDMNMQERKYPKLELKMPL
jgi:hypothetical protein